MSRSSAKSSLTGLRKSPMKKSSNSIKWRCVSPRIASAPMRRFSRQGNGREAHRHAKVKAVITDPPYGVAVTESKEGFRRSPKQADPERPSARDEEYRAFTRNWIKPSVPILNARTASISSTRTRCSLPCVTACMTQGSNSVSSSFG